MKQKLVVLALLFFVLLPSITFAQKKSGNSVSIESQKQMGEDNKNHSKDSSKKKLDPVINPTSEEKSNQPFTIEEQEKLLRPNSQSPSNTETTTNTTPKKTVLDTSDIEAYGLAPEVKDAARSNSYRGYRPSRPYSSSIPKSYNSPSIRSYSSPSPRSYSSSIPKSYSSPTPRSYSSPSVRSYSSPSPKSHRPGKDVSVQAYTRKNGTSVRSHTRSSPRR